MTYRVKVVDKAGAAAFGTGPDAGFLPNVDIEPFGHELNRPGFAGFTVHSKDAVAIEPKVVEREVQIFRDATFAGWFVPTRRERRRGRVNFKCRGLSWFLDRRFIGKADRTNWLLNPEFESATDLEDWTAVNTTASNPVGEQRILGAKSAKLEQASANQDAYLSQEVNVVGTGVGSLYTVAAYFYVVDAGWLGSALNKRGLTLSRKDAPGGTVILSSPAGPESDIDGLTPRGSWQRAETTVWVPPDAAETLEVRLYSPGGTIYWDAVTLTLMESLSFDDADVTTIVTDVVAHLQDPAFGKSDLNFDVDAAPSGVIVPARAYQHADHHNGGRVLRGFTDEDAVCDISIEHPDPTSRVVTVHAPSQGSLRTDLAADDVAVTDVELVDWVENLDAEAGASAVTMLGDGDGPDREEGAAVDTGAFGGVTIEEVLSAPRGTPIDSLDTAAAEQLRLRDDPRTLTLTFKADGIVGDLDVGDRIPVDIVDYTTAVTGEWRVIKWTCDPEHDTVTTETNPA